MDLFVVTPGDPDGVGPEICWKAARQIWGNPSVDLLFVGARKPFDELGASVIEVTEEALRAGAQRPKPKKDAPFIWLLAAPAGAPKKGLFVPGFQSGWSIEKATRLVQEGIARAIITGPISKARLQRGGYKYPGHTEFLAKLCRKQGATREAVPEVTMMLANDQLRISLVTTHVALTRVSRTLTRPKLRRAILQTVEHLQRWWAIPRPRVAVAALNPHAGESGLFGKEEQKTIEPELRALRKKLGAQAELIGPIPADTLFAKNRLAPDQDKYDAVVCMYHDQGLIPVKLLDFRKTVNVTLGLPIVRTSVDHGVGFDIAKTGKADPSSLISAIDLAREIVMKLNSR